MPVLLFCTHPLSYNTPPPPYVIIIIVIVLHPAPLMTPSGLVPWKCPPPPSSWGLRPQVVSQLVLKTTLHTVLGHFPLGMGT